jgi:hypothetical protein
VIKGGPGVCVWMIKRGDQERSVIKRGGMCGIKGGGATKGGEVCVCG